MRLILAFLVVLILVSPAWAGWDEGVAAYNKGEFKTALGEFRPLARGGNKDAQFALGMMYVNGHGLKQDFLEAGRWFRRAARQGMAEAQGALGALYSGGKGLVQDKIQAYMWFHLAASGGSQRAVKFRDDLAGNLSKAEIAQAEKAAEDWRKKNGLGK